MNQIIEQVKELVWELCYKDNSGHGYDHVLRVFDLSMKFMETEKGESIIVALASLLHDVDDYKIVGKENSENNTNTKLIMAKLNINTNRQIEVLNIINTMGYSKLLKGIRPTSLEGKIVSDADMCDAIGAHGIIRSIVYAVSNKGNGIIFDRNIYPLINITSLQYNSNERSTTHDTDSAINHFFEKLLKLNNLMLSASGKKESQKRQKIMIDFLKCFFSEENAPEWNNFLDDYLEKENNKRLIL